MMEMQETSGHTSTSTGGILNDSLLLGLKLGVVLEKADDVYIGKGHIPAKWQVEKELGGGVFA